MSVDTINEKFRELLSLIFQLTTVDAPQGFPVIGTIIFTFGNMHSPAYFTLHRASTFIDEIHNFLCHRFTSFRWHLFSKTFGVSGGVCPERVRMSFIIIQEYPRIHEHGLNTLRCADVVYG